MYVNISDIDDTYICYPDHINVYFKYIYIYLYIHMIWDRIANIINI